MHSPQPRLLTIGHSNQTLEAFLALLKQHGVDLLVDVRSVPKSRFAPQFNAANLNRALDEARIEHLYLGSELGGRPPGAEFYDAEGHVLYSHLAASDEFSAGLSRLRSALPVQTVAVMCAEENPVSCHRRLLVGHVLFEQGHPVFHIRRDGRLQPEEQLLAEERGSSRQLGLGGLDEEKEWRSAHPVRPAPPNTARRIS